MVFRYRKEYKEFLIHDKINNYKTENLHLRYKFFLIEYTL